jgi:hypothetical protein
VQVATRSHERKNSVCCEYNEDDVVTKLTSASMRVQAARLRAGESRLRAVGLLSTQIVGIQAKAIFIGNSVAHCMQRRRQRFPTVRTAGNAVNGEVMANTHYIRACASTVF